LKIGLSLPQAGQGSNAKENLVYAAKQAEENGFDSIWVFERLLWPMNPQSKYPATSDGRLPIEYQEVMDPLTTLSFLAGNTKSIKLGTAVIDMLFHNPIALSKRFATLDVLSEGRTIAGLGTGWLNEEYVASNTPFINRGKRADEIIEILKKAWTEDTVEFKGQFYDIPSSIIGPKPIQKPLIPLYLGGSSPNVLDRIIKHGLNGWLGVLTGTFEEIEKMTKIFRDKTIMHKRDFNSFDHILLTHPKVIENPDHSKINNSRIPMTGTIDQIGTDIIKIKELGIEHIIFGFGLSNIFKDVDSMIDIAREFSKFAR
jgi:probable F420-dependent oxidoreductase